MPYNLMDERWIPVRRASGAFGWIAPWEIGDPNDPPLRIESGRPDFDGALIQFLIGLMQTASAPVSLAEWREWQKMPLLPSELKERFIQVREAFNLDGDGPRFMQDSTVRNLKRATIEWMLLDTPKENARERNSDLFVKRESAARLSLPAAAAALMTFQVNGVPVTGGYREGLRGKGPLTTLIAALDLWRHVTCNLLTVGEFNSHVPGNVDAVGNGAVFPWMAETLLSRAGEVHSAVLFHPLVHFWGTPHRVYLHVDPESTGRCAFYAELPASVLFFSRDKYGPNYKGGFRHPLTPHQRERDDPANTDLRPLRPSRKGLTYRDWARVSLGLFDVAEAAVVAQYRAKAASACRLIAFGYCAEKGAKVEHWVGGTAPLLGATLQEDDRVHLRGVAEQLLTTSEYVLSFLLTQLFRATRGTRDANSVAAQFWTLTESAFLGALSAIGEDPANQDLSERRREAWLRDLEQVALFLFDSYSGLHGDFAHARLRDIGPVRRKLKNAINPSSSKALRTHAGLFTASPARNSTRRSS